jgi:4a-hydroxytetrahydrobiopterin dehydratase
MAGSGTLRVYDEAEIRARLVDELRHWRYEAGSICRTYRTQGWKATLMVVNAIGHLAEAAWHHPELRATYPAVEVRLDTHEAGGVTDRDFDLARRIEALVTWQPGGEDGPFEGTPEDERFAYVKHDP